MIGKKICIHQPPRFIEKVHILEIRRTKRMKKLVSFIIAGLFLTPISSFAGAQNPEFNRDYETSGFEETVNATSKMDDFINSKSMVEGENTKSNGDKYYISLGTGVINAQKGSKNYMLSRNNAFQAAMLEAKRAMVEHLGVAISKDIELALKEGEPLPEQTDAQQPENEPSLFDKSNAYLNAKMDQLLAEEGIDLKAKEPIPDAVKQKVLASQAFKSSIKAMAQARIAGLQTYKVFEYAPDGEKGEIGVIAIQSKKLNKMATAIFTGSISAMPNGTPKRRIQEQIPQNITALMGTFGVQSITDENGNLVLLAYGQGVPATKSKNSLKNAYKKAKLRAMGDLRSFAGETVAFTSDLDDQENFEEFIDEMESHSIEQYYEDKIKSTAKALKISGISTIKRWSGRHPFGGAPIAGVVISWSPQAAGSANQMKKSMAEPKKSVASTSGRAPTAHQRGTGQKGDYEASGASADEDSF